MSSCPDCGETIVGNSSEYCVDCNSKRVSNTIFDEEGNLILGPKKEPAPGAARRGEICPKCYNSKPHCTICREKYDRFCCGTNASQHVERGHLVTHSGNAPSPAHWNYKRADSHYPPGLSGTLPTRLEEVEREHSGTFVRTVTVVAQRWRDWVFTRNNPTSKNMDSIYDSELIRYMIYQLEEAMSGTKHLQGYVEFHEPITFDEMLELFADFHFEPRRGSREKARSYSSKTYSRIGGPWVLGEWVEDDEYQVQCSALTKKGKQCKRFAMWGQETCREHQIKN